MSRICGTGIKWLCSQLTDDGSDVDADSYVPLVLAGRDALQRGILTC